MSKKEIIKRLDKNCARCGGKIKVVLYRDKSYRGGHYFGEVPLYKKGELNKALKSGTTKKRKEPKPYKFKEYWECPKCYWRSN